MGFCGDFSWRQSSPKIPKRPPKPSKCAEIREIPRFFDENRDFPKIFKNFEFEMLVIFLTAPNLSGKRFVCTNVDSGTFLGGCRNRINVSGGLGVTCGAGMTSRRPPSQGLYQPPTVVEQCRPASHFPENLENSESKMLVNF